MLSILFDAETWAAGFPSPAPPHAWPADGYFGRAVQSVLFDKHRGRS